VISEIIYPWVLPFIQFHIACPDLTPVIRIRWLTISHFIVDLRYRVAKPVGVSSIQTDSMSRFEASMAVIQRVIDEEFTEPLYPIPLPTGDDNEEGELRGANAKRWFHEAGLRPGGIV
jgi:hypothetical protein